VERFLPLAEFHAQVGSLFAWVKTAPLAQGAGVEMSSHLFPEVSCHLLAVTPTCHWLEFVDWADAILQEPLAVKDGFVTVPEKPMLWNEEAVRRYQL